MTVNSSALQAVEWCNPSTSCYGFCRSIAIIASGDGRQRSKVKGVRVCVCVYSMHSAPYGIREATRKKGSEQQTIKYGVEQLDEPLSAKSYLRTFLKSWRSCRYMTSLNF